MELNTIAISDGITMGTAGMRASLVSRELIADSIELVASAHAFDALVTISGCDKTIPGTVMALARLNIPGLMLYGGSIRPGHYKGAEVTIQQVFEAVGEFAAGKITEEELHELEEAASPGAGACGGQFTANTMAMAFEALGISPAGTAMVPAEDGRKLEVAVQVGELVMDVLRRGQLPSDVITKPGLENAIAAIATSGGSTNGVLHLLAVAHEMGVPLEIDEFEAISERTPLLCDLQPGGQYVATELYEAGGVPLVLARLKEAGILNADAPTVTGRTIGEHADEAVETDGQRVVRARTRAEGGRRGRDPRRGACRRPGHARDALRHGSDRGRGPRRGGCADNRRALLWSDAWLHGRPRSAGGRSRRANRCAPRRRRADDRRGHGTTRRSALRRGDRGTRECLPPAAASGRACGHRDPEVRQARWQRRPGRRHQLGSRWRGACLRPRSLACYPCTPRSLRPWHAWPSTP
jgi:hypothetical protein